MRIGGSHLVAALALAVGPRAAPAVPPALEQLRLSPDGRYVLAQDGSGIAILTVEPFRVMRRIPVETATAAEFTPDSREIVFVRSFTVASGVSVTLARSNPRVVRCSVAHGACVESMDLPARSCGTLEASPDGRALLCLDYGGTLRAIDVASSATIIEKTDFAGEFISDTGVDSEAYVHFDRTKADRGSATIAFSPDGRYVMARPIRADGDLRAWDLRNRTEIRLAGGLRKVNAMHPLFGSMSYLFVSSDRVLIPQPDSRPALVAFPSGQILSRPKAPPGIISRTGDPAWVTVRPAGLVVSRVRAEKIAQDTRRIALNLSTGQIITTKASSFDILGDLYTVERPNGGLGLFERGKGLRGFVSAADLGRTAGPSSDGLWHLRVSPDGRRAIAQNDLWIHVISLHPFRVLFRIPGNNSTPAEFVDSEHFGFVNSSAQAERWSVDERTCIDRFPIPVEHWCESERTSADGRTHVCVDYYGTLRVLDLTSGSVVFEKKSFGRVVPERGNVLRGDISRSPKLEWDAPVSSRIEFSPDSSNVLAVPEGSEGRALAWNIPAKRAVRLAGELTKLDRKWHFTFISSDRLMMSPDLPQPRVTAQVVAFPSGKLLSQPILLAGPLSRTATLKVVVVRARTGTRTAAVDYENGQALITETPALDVYGSQYVTELTNGDLALYERATGLTATIPAAELRALKGR
jgi:WD40 repeat protein